MFRLNAEVSHRYDHAARAASVCVRSAWKLGKYFIEASREKNIEMQESYYSDSIFPNEIFWKLNKINYISMKKKISTN